MAIHLYWVLPETPPTALVMAKVIPGNKADAVKHPPGGSRSTPSNSFSELWLGLQKAIGYDARLS